MENFVKMEETLEAKTLADKIEHWISLSKTLADEQEKERARERVLDLATRYKKLTGDWYRRPYK